MSVIERPWVRYVAAAVLVFLLAAPPFAHVLAGWDGEVEVSDAVGIAVIGLVFFAVGFLIGRWWSIPLLAVPVLLVLPLGENPEDSDGWTYAWLLIWGPLVIGVPFLLVGLMTRGLLSMVRKRQPVDR
jgi:hypothetical protein